MSKEQINLPKTAFSMKANLPIRGKSGDEILQLYPLKFYLKQFPYEYYRSHKVDHHGVQIFLHLFSNF